MVKEEVKREIFVGSNADVRKKYLKLVIFGPDWWLVWTLSHKAKGHMPELLVQSQAGELRRGNQSMFLSHIDVSLPLSLAPSPVSKHK